MTGVMGLALALVFVDWAVLVWIATGLLVVFLSLNLRQFNIGTWVPALLSVLVLVLSLPRELPVDVYLQACNRMVFLAALMAVLNTLRTAAARAPEVIRAGQFLVSQPASRRYLALTFGGHLFGVLINFGGLAIMLDLAMRAMKERFDDPRREALQEVRLRRMVLAVLRGFGLIAMWSPLGFAANVVLITLPGLSYVQFGPLGFAMTFVFVAIGWGLDRITGRKYRNLGLPQPHPPKGAWVGAALLMIHVVVLGGAVIGLHEITTLSFQKALIVMVPLYAVGWTLWSSYRAGGLVQGVADAVREVWERQSRTAGEVGIFAAAGFLPVVLLAILPMGPLQAGVESLGLGPIGLALSMSAAVMGGALLGINPIVVASVAGAVALEMNVPGLSELAIGLGIIGGWSAVMGLSPFMTTLVFGASIVERPAWRIGLMWNAAYSVSILVVWSTMLVVLMLTGVA